MNQLLLHIRRILFAFLIDLRPQQHWWLEEQGGQVPWILLENSQANDNSERHNRNPVSQSQDDGVESTIALWGMCALDPKGGLDLRKSTCAALVRWSRFRWRWTTTKWWGWGWQANRKNINQRRKVREKQMMYLRKIKAVQMKRIKRVLPSLQSCYCWHQVSNKSIMVHHGMTFTSV